MRIGSHRRMDKILPGYGIFHVSTEMTTYEFEYEMTEKDDNNGRLEFNLGNRGSMATVYITNVRLEETE